MVGSYAQSAGALELRKPAQLFAPIAWLIAGPLNPAGFIAIQVWDSAGPEYWLQDFDPTYWAVSVAVPLAIGTAGSLFYLRGGGFGFMSLGLITMLVTLAACAVTGPVYTIALWALMQVDIFLSPLPLWDFNAAVMTSGTFIRIGIQALAIPIVPAIIILRLIAFQREAKKAAR
jgi:hypothetical protein